MTENNWNLCVVKPAVGASAEGVSILNINTIDGDTELLQSMIEEQVSNQTKRIF